MNKEKKNDVKFFFSNLRGDRDRLLNPDLERFEKCDRSLDLDLDRDKLLFVRRCLRLRGDRDSDLKIITSSSSLSFKPLLLGLRRDRLVDGETLPRPKDELDILEMESKLFLRSALRLFSSFPRFGGSTTTGDGSRFFGSKFDATK